jgi:anaerobic glycerol-3-phosphate dehydrogenase
VESFDVAVIGGGAAGTAAALAASAAGARVVLVSRGPGATALAAGGWHDAPPDPFRAALAAAGLPLIACDGLLPHPDGAVRRSAVAPASHAAAALAPEAPAALVCGIAGLAGFHAPALTALWSDAAGLPRGSLTPVTLELDGTPAAGWPTASLAALVAREPQRLAAPLRHALERHPAARVLLPAVLGLLDHAETRAALEHAVGVTVAEALAVAPSVPGWRLTHALGRALETAAVRTLRGTISAHRLDENEIRLAIGDNGAVDGLAARAVVLAAGKYLGGGITAGEEFEEPALGCDVAFQRFARTIDDPAAALILTDPERTEPQPVLAAGVRVDNRSRPLGAAGTVFSSAIFVAGSARAGVATATLGLGGAASDGWAAGESAAAHAGH